MLRRFYLFYFRFLLLSLVPDWWTEISIVNSFLSVRISLFLFKNLPHIPIWWSASLSIRARVLCMLGCLSKFLLYLFTRARNSHWIYVHCTHSTNIYSTQMFSHSKYSNFECFLSIYRNYWLKKNSTNENRKSKINHSNCRRSG